MNRGTYLLYRIIYRHNTKHKSQSLSEKCSLPLDLLQIKKSHLNDIPITPQTHSISKERLDLVPIFLLFPNLNEIDVILHTLPIPHQLKCLQGQRCALVRCPCHSRYVLLLHYATHIHQHLLLTSMAVPWYL